MNESRLEEVTRQLDRIKRAQSHHEDGPLSPGSSLLSGTQEATPSSSRNDGGFQLDTATAFGLDQVEDEYSQVSPQSLENYHLSGPDIVILFRKYEGITSFLWRYLLISV